MNLLKINAIVILMTLAVFSCKKIETAVNTEKDVQMATDNSQSEQLADETSTMSDDAYNNGKLTVRGGQGGSAILGDTVRVTRVDSVVTIDFGVNGVTSSKDGKTRKGKIIITFNNGYKKEGSTVTTTFSNYYVDNIQITGTRSITYNGLNTSNQPYWSISSTLTFIKPSGTATWTSTRVRTMIAGYNTPLDWSDDQYTVTGTASGTTVLGDAYTMTITTPLLVKVGCRYIQNGVIVFTRNSSTATIDYGYGGSATCENTALLTYNGTTKVITL